MTTTMKVLCLLLMFTSLATAGFFTPKSSKDDSTTAVKEGSHAGVKVEFEKDDGNTKVLISPQDDEEKGSYMSAAKEKLSDTMEDATEKLKEASSNVLHPNEASEDEQEEESSHVRFSPRELVCDAYGKCKHKIASALGKTKDAMKETVHEAADKVYKVEEEAKEVLSQTTDKVKDTVTHKGHEASDKAQEMKDTVKDKAGEVQEGLREKSKDAMEKVKDTVTDTAHKAHDKAKGTKETASGKASEVKEGAKERAKHGAEKIQQQGKKGFKLILHRAGNVFSYIVPWKTMASVTGVFHLLGFSVAYGTSLWVTFASSYVLAGALPRYQFAMVQSKIYPVYFKAMASSIGLAMLGHLMSPRKRFSAISMGMLTSSLVMTLGNMLLLEPRATKVMFERMKKEKEEGSAKQGKETEPHGAPVVSEATTGTAEKRIIGAQEKSQEKSEASTAETKKAETTTRSDDRLRQLNSYSSILNVLTLVSLTWHLVHLGKNLHSVC